MRDLRGLYMCRISALGFELRSYMCFDRRKICSLDLKAGRYWLLAIHLGDISVSSRYFV